MQKPASNSTAEKLIVFTQGGKGGVGKTTLTASLLDYYAASDVPTIALDLDTENKDRAGLAYFHPAAAKVNIDQRDGLDAFIDALDREDAAVIVADMGARSGAPTFQWFEQMFDAVKEMGVRFTSIGVVTEDPGSVASVVEWATKLQGRVSYLIALNKLGDPNQAFRYWHDAKEAQQFREVAKPEVITLESINPDLQNAIRNHGLTIGQVAEGKATAPELSASKFKIRAQQIRRQLAAEFDRVSSLLLP